MVVRNRRTIFWFIILVVLLLGLSQFFFQATHYQDSNPIINEFVASNRTGLTDEDGDYSDWVEIYNPGPAPVNLSGWALSDDPNHPQKWTFPDITLRSQEYLVVFASGKNRQQGAALHANFQLSRQGEFLGLYNILDERWLALEIPPQFQDVAYGRYGSESAYGYLTPTPGQPNPDTPLWAGLVDEVKFSARRGFYNAPFSLELSSATPNAVIRYTLDGSEPTESRGQIYSQPLQISHTTLVRTAAFKPNYKASGVKTHSYIFVEDVLAQPANPPGFPPTWGVHFETIKGFEAGAPVQADYQMDPRVVNDPRYRARLLTGLKAIPSISLVMEAQSFNDIYANPREEGRVWERPASIEFIDPHNPEGGFQINAGVRIHGDLGRQEYMHKHSFRFFFRREYGEGRLEYPLFPNSPVEQFETLVLRAGVQDSWLGLQAERRRDATYTRDEWLRASQLDMSGYGVHGRFAHLYINGLYWGLYNLIERPDDAYGASYFNVNRDDWFAFNHGGNINVSLEQAQAMFEDFMHATRPEAKYAAIAPLIDTTAFADYVILNWYAGTGEWAENNWYAGYHPQASKIKFFGWDGELIWKGNAPEITFGKSNPPGYLWPNTVEQFFKALIYNPDFKMEFADRLYRHLYHDGALTDENAQARFVQINQQINTAITGESARWGDSKHHPPLTPDDWQKAVNQALSEMEGAADKLISLTRQAGYYPPIDPPAFNQRGGLIAPGFALTMSTRPQDHGLIYYTTDGSDPRLPGGAVNPNARVYQWPLPLPGTTHLKARLLDGLTWSALAEARFYFVEQDSPLRITEIMYNPRGSDDTEFIELQNIGSRPVELAGLSFEGIRFTFPANTPPLSPGQFAVLARDAPAFARRYPGIPIAGQYDGQLSNRGEKIVIKDAQGRVVTEVEYDDDNGWPLSADGRGDSLALVNPNGVPNDPKNWRASTHLHGSPGADDFNYDE